ncbi:MAG TPA: phosphatidylserine decarboxylase family protein [Candidatus Aquilonibacter sp.]|nr:phosphatidylserine decarboxylase family protein [Candidatus Aquilonibacter sp.]
MVRDGYYYALALIAAAVLVGLFASPVLAVIPVLLAIFFLWFFRDPERAIPDSPGAIVSPADGKVTSVSITSPSLAGNDARQARISIFLNVFDVHVNRSPIQGIVRDVRYKRGKFLNAMNERSAEHNEQNVVTVEGDGQTVIFKQIAGLLARRIVFQPQIGEHLQRGQRVGMMKFGSRVDVFFDTAASVKVKVGEHVRGGESVLAYLQPKSELASVTRSAASERGVR